MNGKKWLVLGMSLAAGCGGGEKKAETPAKTPEKPAATDGALVKAETPKTILSANALMEDAGSHAGRIGVEGAVLEVNATKSMFLLVDVSEADCIGAG